jgi:hypothetical protein
LKVGGVEAVTQQHPAGEGAVRSLGGEDLVVLFAVPLAV